MMLNRKLASNVIVDKTKSVLSWRNITIICKGIEDD